MNNKYPLTSPQKLIYDMQKFAGGSIATICASISIKGHRDIDSIKKAVNEMYRFNDAMRIRIVEEDGVPMQFAEDYVEKDVEILRFENKAEMDDYAQNYAREPMDFDDSLCDIKAFVLNDSFGIVAKMHHIVSDAWTLTLVASQFYALVNGETPETYSYFDFLESDKAYIDSPKFQKDKEYFITEFQKCEEVTYLSDKRSDSFLANRKTFFVPTDETAKITNYAKHNNSSVFMLLMTIVGTYLNRIKMNTERLYIGTAMLNRFGYEQKNTMGMFVNTAPVLVEIENEKTFSENLAATSKKAMQIMRHQKYNYGELLKELRTFHNFTEKLYDVMISYQNAKIIGETGSFESTWYHCGMQTESLQIHIDDHDSEGILKIHYDYQTDKFTEDQVARIHNHIFNLLFDAINDDTKKPYELDILSQEEKQTLLYDFNDTAMDYPKDKCVHQLFEEQVAKTPKKIALKFPNREFTYSELNGMANAIAKKLRKMDVGKNDIVTLISKRSYHLVVAILGILKAGAAYLPIDYNYPQDRIDYIIDDAKCKAIVTFDVDIDRDNVLKLDNKLPIDEEELKCVNVSNDLCAVIYTSGSTGTPKGTLLQHKGLVNYTYANDALYDGGDCNIGFATYTFDAFFLDIISPILRGNLAVIATEKQQFEQKGFEKLIKDTPNCNFFITPAKLKQFIDGSEDKTFLKDVNKICIGGEVFPKELLEFFSEKTQIFNVYGPTECSMWSVGGEIKQEETYE